MKLIAKIMAVSAVVLFAACNNTEMKNPLLEESTIKYGAPQFDLIKTEHYKPAIEVALDRAYQDVNAIINNQEEPTFENTILALNYAGEDLNRILSIMYNVKEADTNDELEQIAEDITPDLTKFEMYTSLNDTLFQKVKTVWEMRDSLNLNMEDARLLEQTYKGYVRNGANLPADKKEEFSKINEELSLASLKYSKNALNATNAYIMHITDSAEIAELPDFVKSAAASEAKERNLEGWVFTLQQPSMSPFMKYSTNRERKKELWMASSTKSVSGEFSNEESIRTIVDLRIKAANLLGYPTHADRTLENKMAKNRETVENFLKNLTEQTYPFAKAEIAEVQAYMNKTQEGQMMPWDFAYYSEKLKNEKFSINDELLKPYFKLDNVKNAVFALADSLYGLKFTPAPEIPGYHPDVEVFDVSDANGRHMAVLYTDFYPRASKRGGAWMTEFRGQSFSKDGKEQRPFISIVMNFTKPTETEPSLLTFYEVTTLLHEFGHALHGMLAEGKYESLNGTSVARDFVELPSQIMENWAYEPEYLQTFAKHYQTGEAIPQEYINKIVESKNYLAGYSQLRQLEYGLIDMAWHTLTEVPSEDAVTFENNVRKATAIMPIIEGTASSPTFSHIFAGGYSAGYYSYKWAEVLEADAFQMFKENGIFNKEISGKFRDCILSKGDIQDADILYRNFRGRDPQPEALMIKQGLVKK